MSTAGSHSFWDFVPFGRPASHDPAAPNHAHGHGPFGYHVTGQLGVGAGAIVYEIADPQTHLHFALKHVVCRGPKDGRFVEQLRGEYEVGRAVTHEGLRKSLALNVHRSLLGHVHEAALALELVDGKPPTLPMADLAGAARVLAHVARALEGLHAAGFVHCDLKPQNVLVDATGRARLIDLGQACRVGTVKERIQGTPDYIAPEQVRCQPVSTRTDSYGWGAMAYALLTGQVLPTLFTLDRGPNSFLVDTCLRSPRDLRPDVPAPLSDLVMACVHTTPAKRPEMPEVSRRLEAVRFLLRKSHDASQQSAAGVRNMQRWANWKEG